MEQEVVDERYDSQEFKPVFPPPEPWGLNSEFRFTNPEALLYFPAMDIGKEDFPGSGFIVNRDRSEDIHGAIVVMLISSNDQPYFLIGVIRMGNFTPCNGYTFCFVALFVPDNF